MSLRATPAAWFELVVGRDCLAQAIQVLADTGLVELEDCQAHRIAADCTGLRQLLEDGKERLARFAEHHPRPRYRDFGPRLDLCDTLAGALQRVSAWTEAAAPRVEAIDRQQRRVHALEALAAAIEAAAGGGVDLGAMNDLAPDAFARLFRFAETPGPIDLPEDALAQSFEDPDHGYLLLVGTASRQAALQAHLEAAGAEPLPWPEAVAAHDDPAAAARDLLRQEGAALDHQRLGLDELGEELDLAGALGDIERLSWLAEHLERVPVGEYLATVTGWTSDAGLSQLPVALESAGVPALIQLTEPPGDRQPPTLLRNPTWARPFELFARQMGTPGTAEADPTRMLALVVPLLFGFMFGDVAHGAVLWASGVWLRRRWPAAGVLIPAGLASTLFGLLYGSVLAVEGLIAPWWLSPLEAPLTVLVVPLAAGALLMVVGLLLGGLHSFWLGHGMEWLSRDAALVLMLIGLCALPLTVAGAVALAVALVWYVAGETYTQRRLAALPAALAGFLERALQLAVNTLSFVRVGAFALAHAGLGAAVTHIALASDSPWLTGGILILGNALIILLEGLVVSIQTTRLVLFEFFIRFFAAEGRPFRPILLPK